MMEIEERKELNAPYLIPTEVRWRVVFYKKENMSNRATAKLVQEEYGRPIDHKSVQRIWDTYSETGSVSHNWSKTGRPQVLLEEDLQALTENCVENRTASVKERKEELGLEAGRSTINRALLNLGFKAYRARKKPILTDEHIEKRLEFALDHEEWTETDWHRVVFTDECAFRLVNSNGRLMIRRLEDEEWEEGTYQPCTGKGKSVFVWGAISSEGVGPLVRFEDTVTAEEYVGAFRYRLRRYYPELYGGNMIYQHDNAPSHKANFTVRWFEEKNIEILEWPAISPDLNIIENVWGRLKYELRADVFEELDDVWEEVQRLWKKIITRDFILDLYRSLPRRINAVIQHEGRHTKY